jgi:hypothetical protein
LIEAAKRDHSIERLGAGDAIVGQPSQSGFCMSDHLRQSKTEVRGRSYLAHVFSKADRRQYVSIDLTRWEGVDGWWVSSVTFKDKCLQM